MGKTRKKKKKRRREIQLPLPPSERGEGGVTNIACHLQRGRKRLLTTNPNRKKKKKKKKGGSCPILHYEKKTGRRPLRLLYGTTGKGKGQFHPASG